ncbi:MAG: hypothetical protein ACLTNE_05370 [Intestinimonas butyriciproducens]|uniref:Uncharacterized protein n=2 Tax=Intestinimonas butyriciproducens TaxID=1297617 RepID=A0A0S2W286_9FIRM|nr:hypothetical protein [Intestinimonas butyriciproducens]ALP93476.1 hypothetical protein IB211_01083c [Intestinimonas butyriciproducens]MBS6522358.1 hypothetical protein [Clostridiales bacterium]
MKGQNFMKITSILMIAGGIIAGIAGVIAILGVSTLVALAGSAEGAGLLYASSIIVTIASIIEIIAGVKGLKACKAPELAKKCVTWGILIVVVSIISMVIGLIGGGEFSISNLALNLLVPGLYIYGALQIKSAE